MWQLVAVPARWTILMAATEHHRSGAIAMGCRQTRPVSGRQDDQKYLEDLKQTCDQKAAPVW